jgi:hypothetical protein
VDVHPDLRPVPKESVWFVLAVLPEALSWSKVQRLSFKIGVEHLSERTFYRTQKLHVASLCEIAEADCDQHFEPVTQGEGLSFDGSSAHPRNAFKSIGTLGNRRLNKTISLEITEKRS